MKMYLISDNVDTLTGMRLAGVEGVVVHGRKEAKAAVEKVLEDKNLGILLITEKLSFEIPEVIDDIKLKETAFVSRNSRPTWSWSPKEFHY